jgi:ectoine hydroxylase-related dioxygenase (phytanoyl-CoA dioxygenase family)
MSGLLAERLEVDGFVVARSFFSRSDLQRLNNLAESAYAAVDNGAGDAETQQSVSGWGGLGLPLLSQVGASESSVAEIIAAIEKVAAMTLGPCRLIRKISLFRRHLQPRTHIRWHIDADAAGTRCFDPCFNVWLPLVAVGRDLPSLQFVRSSHQRMRTVPLLTSDDAVRTDEWVAERFQPDLHLTAELDAGDAVIFDHYVLHRTQPMSSQKGIRISGEFRVTLNGQVEEVSSQTDRSQREKESVRVPLGLQLQGVEMIPGRAGAIGA